MEHAIEASVRLTEPLRHVRAALTEEPGILVAADIAAGGRGRERFDGALAIELQGGTKVQQALVGELGPSVWTDDVLVLPVEWKPASHEHLLPTFVGEFECTADHPGCRLVLRGSYTVPLGPAGAVGDHLAGRRVAQRVLDDHLVLVAKRLDEAARRTGAAARERSPAGSDEGPGPENYIG